MAMFWFTATAIILYVVADWLLQFGERRLGRRLEQRSLVFFVLLLGLALPTFALLRNVLG